MIVKLNFLGLIFLFTFDVYNFYIKQKNMSDPIDEISIADQLLKQL